VEIWLEAVLAGFKMFSPDLYAESDKSHKNSQSGYLISETRAEPGFSQSVG
jgi:hypothetical protein